MRSLQHTILATTNHVNRDPQDKTTSNQASNQASDHKNEGFLKSAWHRLTHQHDNLEPEQPPKDETKNNKDDEEPKKASGSG